MQPLGKGDRVGKRCLPFTFVASNNTESRLSQDVDRWMCVCFHEIIRNQCDEPIQREILRVTLDHGFLKPVVGVDESITAICNDDCAGAHCVRWSENFDWNSCATAGEASRVRHGSPPYLLRIAQLPEVCTVMPAGRRSRA